MIEIKIYEEDWRDWFEGGVVRDVFFKPPIFDLLSEKFGREIKEIEIRKGDKRDWLLPFGYLSRRLGLLKDQDILKIAGIITDEVRLIKHYCYRYSPQTSHLMNVKDWWEDEISVVKTVKPAYTLENNRLLIYL